MRTHRRDRQRTETLALVLVVAFGILAALVASPSTARALGGATTTGSVDIGALHEAAAQLESSVSGVPGFGSIAFTPSEDGLLLYWKGGPPTAVADEVGALRKTVSILVINAAYTGVELAAERDRLSIQSEMGIGPQIYEIGPKPDDSGLMVTVARGSIANAAAAGETIDAALGSRISATVSEGDRPVAAYRRNDTVPFYGGIQLWSLTGGLCSTGGQVHSGTTKWMVTANHCATEVFYTYPSTSSQVGDTDVNKISTYYDVQLIHGRSYSTQIYSGAWDSPNSSTIVGVWNSYVGDGIGVCMEGGFTGQVCGNKVTATGQNVNYGGGIGIVHGLTFSDYTGSAANSAEGEGDSGGPVVYPVTGGVRVAGMIDGVNPPFASGPCWGDPNEANRICSKHAIWLPQATITGLFGVNYG